MALLQAKDAKSTGAVCGGRRSQLYEGVNDDPAGEELVAEIGRLRRAIGKANNDLQREQASARALSKHSASVAALQQEADASKEVLARLAVEQTSLLHIVDALEEDRKETQLWCMNLMEKRACYDAQMEALRIAARATANNELREATRIARVALDEEQARRSRCDAFFVAVLGQIEGESASGCQCSAFDSLREQLESFRLHDIDEDMHK